MASHIEIGGLWGHSQAQKLGTERFVSLSPFWKTFMQTRNLLIDMVAQSFQRTLGVVVVELIDFYDVIKVEHRKLLITAIAIAPDVPSEKWPNDFGIELEECFEIEESPIVERCHDADIMERGSIALKILNGIHISVKYIRILTNLLRHERGSLHEIIVVCIHASNHIGP